jgi:hypothetical protein
MKKIMLNAKNRRADITVETTLTLVIAVVAISLFVLIITTEFPAISKSIYCGTLSPLKRFFSPDSSALEERYCNEKGNFSQSMLRMETAKMRKFYTGLDSAEMQFPSSGGKAEAQIEVPNTNITAFEVQVSGGLFQNESAFSDGSYEKQIVFSGTQTHQVFLKLPKGAYVSSAVVNLSPKAVAGGSGVIVFNGHNRYCPRTSAPYDDQVETYLDTHNIEYNTTTGWRGSEADWQDKISNHSILFVGCGLGLTTTNPTDKEFLKNWIASGNTLFATCWAIDLLVDLFGNILDNGWTPYFYRITPYQDCPGTTNPTILNRCVNSQPCYPSSITCQEKVGAAGECSDSQRIIFTPIAQSKYGVTSQPVSVIYEGSPCLEANTSNSDVTVLADIKYDANFPGDKDITLKCAYRNIANPGSVGQAMLEFKYGSGSVIYMTPHIDDQKLNALGQTDFLINLINERMKKVSNIRISSADGSIDDFKYSETLESNRTAKLNVKRINSYLEKCTAEPCLIPINITATNGTLSLNALRIEYYMPIKEVKLSSGSASVDVSGELSPKNISIKVSDSNITKNLNEQLKSCAGKNCIISINASAGSEGFLKLSGLSVSYKYCLVKEELLARALACWERADFGKASSDIKCYELSIPSTCKIVENVNESAITELMLSASGVCDIFGNSDSDSRCGKANNLDWEIINVGLEKNILIEYSSEKGKVVVS